MRIFVCSIQVSTNNPHSAVNPSCKCLQATTVKSDKHKTCTLAYIGHSLTALRPGLFNVPEQYAILRHAKHLLLGIEHTRIQ
jgi:hypothetical protein